MAIERNEEILIPRLWNQLVGGYRKWHKFNKGSEIPEKKSVLRLDQTKCEHFLDLIFTSGFMHDVVYGISKLISSLKIFVKKLYRFEEYFGKKGMSLHVDIFLIKKA